MIQIMHIEFKTSFANLLNVLVRNLIALFGDNLEGCLHSVSIIEIHKLRSEVTPRYRFNVVCHHQAVRRAIWPKPDEGNFLNTAADHQQPQQHFVEIFHGEINRPRWKWKVLPIAEIQAL